MDRLLLAYRLSPSQSLIPSPYFSLRGGYFPFSRSLKERIEKDASKRESKNRQRKNEKVNEGIEGLVRGKTISAFSFILRAINRLLSLH